MPRGVRGSLTHGASAYQRGACRCKAICTPDHARIRKLQRESLQQNPTGGRFVTLAGGEGVVALLTPSEVRVLEALLLDGADTATIARRTRLAERTVSRHITDIQRGFGFTSRIELVVAILKGRVGYRAVASDARRRDVA